MNKQPSAGALPVVLLVVGGGAMNHSFWTGVAVIAVGLVLFWRNVAKTT